MTDFTTLEKALTSLEDSLSPLPRNDRERDGAIQRFEYTFEICWKTAKRVLEEQGISVASPKTVIRELGRQGWVDPERWLKFLKARNLTTYVYEEDTADTVFGEVLQFAKECRKLIQLMKGT